MTITDPAVAEIARNMDVISARARWLERNLVLQLLQVRVTEPMLAEIDRLAHARKISRAAMTRHMMVAGLEAIRTGAV